MATDALPLDARQLSRYSRHIVLPEIGLEGQKKLCAARVLIVGAGGLGSPAALYLAAAGTGTIGLADFDRVEEHNLQRQILHETADIGHPKVESARRRLQALNPYLTVKTHGEGITSENSIDLFSEYDIIVDGSDNFATRYLNTDSAFFAGKPLVYGSIFKFEGQVSLFDPAGGGPCYRCLFPAPPPPGAVPNCDEAGVLGALPGVIGSLQAMETLKVLLEIGEPLRGRLLVVDTLRASFRSVNIKKDPNCPLCGNDRQIQKIDPENYRFSCQHIPPSTMEQENKYPLEIPIEETKRLLDEKNGGVLLLDVREPYERDICTIEGSRSIPMGKIPESLQHLPRDIPILVHCHHGGRSLRVTRFLRDKGFTTVSNVAGGIDAWAEKYDPEMQRY